MRLFLFLTFCLLSSYTSGQSSPSTSPSASPSPSPSASPSPSPSPSPSSSPSPSPSSSPLPSSSSPSSESSSSTFPPSSSPSNSTPTPSPGPPPLPNPYACLYVTCPLYAHCYLLYTWPYESCFCDIYDGAEPPFCTPYDLPTTAFPTLPPSSAPPSTSSAPDTTVAPTSSSSPTAPATATATAAPITLSPTPTKYPLPPIYTEHKIVHLLFSGFAPSDTLLVNVISYYLSLSCSWRLAVKNLTFHFVNTSSGLVLNSTLVDLLIKPAPQHINLTSSYDTSSESALTLALTLVYYANLVSPASYLRLSLPSLISGYMDLDPVPDVTPSTRDDDDDDYSFSALIHLRHWRLAVVVAAGLAAVIGVCVCACVFCCVPYRRAKNALEAHVKKTTASANESTNEKQQQLQQQSSSSSSSSLSEQLLVNNTGSLNRTIPLFDDGDDSYSVRVDRDSVSLSQDGDADDYKEFHVDRDNKQRGLHNEDDRDRARMLESIESDQSQSTYNYQLLA